MTPPNPVILSPADELNALLRVHYARVLDRERLERFAGRGLSSLFVGAVSDSYLRSKVRLMIVGRETAGWGAKLDKDLASPVRCGSVETYLAHQMRHHQDKIGKVARNSKFFQFYRESSRKVSAMSDLATANAPLWANLFCFDVDRSRPDRGHEKQDIVDLSVELLRVQIEVLRPELIVFVTGASCDRYLREHFTDRIDSRVHLEKRLWEFKLPLPPDNDGRTHATVFRTPHPRHAASARIRSAIVDEMHRPGAIAACLAEQLHAS